MGPTDKSLFWMTIWEPLHGGLWVLARNPPKDIFFFVFASIEEGVTIKSFLKFVIRNQFETIDIKKKLDCSPVEEFNSGLICI